MIDEKTMQEDALSEVLLEQYKKLPEALQKAIVSVENTKIIQDIGKKHNLHVDQMSELVDETWLALLGIIRSTDFVGDLKNRLEVDQQKAEEIAKDVNNQIFNEIKSALVEAEKIGGPPREQTLQSEVGEVDVLPPRENILGEIEDKPVQLTESESKTIPISEVTAVEPMQEFDEEKAPEEPDELAESDTEPKDLMEEKLGGEFSVQSTEQEVGKKEVSAPEKKFDPYREAVE